MVVFFQKGHIHPRTIIEAFQVSQGHQSAEVFIPLIIHDQQDQMVGIGSAIGRWGTVPSIPRRHIDFTADNGLDAGLGRPVKEINHAEHVPMIGDGH